MYLKTTNSSAGILSPQLALFLVMHSKAHLTSHPRMSGSKWVTTPSWLSARNTEELYTHTHAHTHTDTHTHTSINDLDNHYGVVSHLDPDFLEWQVKWALERFTKNKAGGGDGIPVVLFQFLKDYAAKVLHSTYQQVWKIQQWPQDWKKSVFIPIPKNGNAKECSNYHTIVLISHANKVMFKILQDRLQQYMNWEFPDI